MAFVEGPTRPLALATGAMAPGLPGVPGVMLVHSTLILSCCPLRKKTRPAAILRRSTVLLVDPESAAYRDAATYGAIAPKRRSTSPVYPRPVRLKPVWPAIAFDP